MSEIVKFYAGKSILITGGTGFVGKALVEKLLRSCQDVKKIYILIRIKNGETINKRIDELISNPV